MDDWQPTRILTAAEFAGRFVIVRVANVARGDSANLIVQVVPQRGPDIDDWPYASWDSRLRIPVPAGWDQPGVNPWCACRFSGPPKSPRDTQSARFCGACGAARAEGSPKCSVCGNPFDSAASSVDIEQLVGEVLVGEVSADTSAAGAKLAHLIDAHVDRSMLDDDDRAVLREFFDADFDELRCTGWVRGDGGDGTADLTLRAAQHIHLALAAGERLSPNQLHQAEVLLKYAPLQFGYWGPFKALVKAVPVDDLADAYAVAVARLSGTDSARPAPAAIRIENVDVVKDWFAVPSKKTRWYLARRMRRDLAALARRSPDIYARVAARMLISWDQPLSGGAYAPAYVMLGAVSPLDTDGRHVDWPADMSVRRDPHPEIWNERPELVHQVFQSLRSSSEALTWAYQVLESLGDVPAIAPEAIAIALDATYPALRRLGCAALPQHPEVFASLDVGQWSAFFEHAADAELTQAGEALSGHNLVSAFVALASVLTTSGAAFDRRGHIALLYLASMSGFRGRDRQADVAALVAAIEQFQLEYQPLWAPLLDRMDPGDLVAGYRTLSMDGADDAALEVLAGSIIEKRWLASDLTLKCVGSVDAKVVELGWRLVDAHGGQQYLFEQVLPSARRAGRLSPAAALRIVSGALGRAGTAQEVVDLLGWALSTDIDRPALAAMLAEIPVGRIALWEAIATDEGDQLSALAVTTPQIIRVIGDSVVAQQLSAAEPAQLALILRYINENPARIARDAAFAVAAVTTTDPSLQGEALRQLRAAGHLPQVWFAVAESARPAAVGAAREYLESVQDVRQVRDAILACIDSAVPAVRDMGIELFRAREALLEDRSVWTALAKSDHQRAQELVAEAALVSSRVDERVLSEFDRRILTDQRPSRRARELVKRRLQDADIATTAGASERIAALLDMARGRVEQDREWALMRLATLAMQGVPIEGLQASLTTHGDVVAKDVAP